MGRGRGIGCAVMDRVEQHADKGSFPHVSLICFDRNTRALDFYRRRGYRATARRALVSPSRTRA